jgi:hypothetical protein
MDGVYFLISFPSTVFEVLLSCFQTFLIFCSPRPGRRHFLLVSLTRPRITCRFLSKILLFTRYLNVSAVAFPISEMIYIQAKPSQAKVVRAETFVKRKSTSLCLLAIPVLTASLGSLTDSLTLTGGCAFANYMGSG